MVAARLLRVNSSASETSSSWWTRGVAFTFKPTSIYSAFGNCVPAPPVETPKSAAESSTMATLFEPKLVTATSGRPSPLKSAVAAEPGLVCNGSSMGGEKMPPPTPIRTASALSPVAGTAISGMPSALKSGGGGGAGSTVAIPQEDRNAVDHGIGTAGHGSTIRDDQIENLIGVHVRERDENRGHPGRVLDRAEERSVSLANISFERVFRRVGDGQIDDRIGIRIEGSSHDRGWLHAGRNQRGRLKSSVGVAQINADRVIALVHYRQIGKTVIVEIGHRDRARQMTRGNGLRRLKRAVAVAQQQAQRVGIFVGHQYVHVVAGVRGEMKVSGHDPRRAGPDRHRGRKVKSSVANAQKYRERSSREIRDDHVLKTVIVQIGRRYVARVYARGQERNLQIGAGPPARRAGVRGASQTPRVLRQGNRNAFADEECRRLSVFRAQQHFSPRTDRGQEIREIQCYVRKGIKKSRDSSPECQERRQRRGSENLGNDRGDRGGAVRQLARHI